MLEEVVFVRNFLRVRDKDNFLIKIVKRDMPNRLNFFDSYCHNIYSIYMGTCFTN